MFGAVSRGVPSFGDLAYKAPVVAASDSAAAWPFPAPTLSPAGAAQPGQTLTGGTNVSLNSTGPFTGTFLAVGDRCLITGDSGGPAGCAGIYVVTQLGSGAQPFILTRATDADTAAELVVGSLVVAQYSVIDGAPVFSYGLWSLQAAGDWSLSPTLLDSLNVSFGTELGTAGALATPAIVHGQLLVDSFELDVANGDIQLVRAGAKLARLQDNAGAAADLDVLGKVTMGAAVAQLSGNTVPTINGGGTATYSSRACRWVQIGPLVVFRISFNVATVGSGATTVTITGTSLPPAGSTFAAVGDRGGTGVIRLVARMVNAGGELTASVISNMSGVVTITGADLAAGAQYNLVGAYLTL